MKNDQNKPFWMNTSVPGVHDPHPIATDPEPPELVTQSRCFLWFWNNYPEHRKMLFHVQNKARNAIEGNKFKALGVVKGVSDFILVTAGAVHFIEGKTLTGRQSPDQVDFQNKVTERGHHYHIYRTESEFKTLVISLLGPPQNHNL